jgi:site-specific recombinase XerD
MNKIVLYVNTKQAKHDKTCTIYVSTVVAGQPVRFSTKVSAPAKDIDLAHGVIRGMSKEVKDKNLIISNCKARLSDIFVRYRLRFSELTPALLRREYEHYLCQFLFYDYAMKKLADKKADMAEGTHRRHVCALKKISKFSPQLRLADVNPTLVQELVRWCKVSRKNKASSILNTVKTLKIYYSIAKKEGLVKGNPFEDLRLRANIPVREYLSPDELRALVALYKRKALSEPLQNVLQYFLFSCFTGLRFSDVSIFCSSHIVGKTVVLQMSKTKNETGKTVKIPITRGVEELMRDAGAAVGTPIFRVITNQKTNVYLKEIMKAAGIEKSISFHCARHTFATNFLINNGEKLATLQELLGHTKIEQTRIYAHVIYESVEESMQFLNSVW